MNESSSSSESSTSTAGFPSTHVIGLPFVALLFVFGLFFAAQGLWIAQNQTIVGNDAGAHLIRSIEVFRALLQPGREALISIWGVSGHRPPLSYILTTPFYALLGLSYDAALWSNVVWLALTGFVVYALAHSLGDAWDGVISAGLTLAIPILFGLSRLYYQEALVTFFLWLALFILIQSDGFTNRRLSAVFGVVFGLGTLVKWTMPALLVGPVLVMLWHSRSDFTDIALPSRHLMAGATGIGILFATGWAWAVAPLVPSTPLLAGFWLTWVLLIVGIGAGLRVRATRLLNLLLAGLVAVFVASLWYFPRFDFADLFVDLVFRDAGRPERFGQFSLLRWHTWGFYVRALLFEHVGIVASLLAGIGLWGIRSRLRERNVQVVVATVAVAWLIFTISPFRDTTRGITPTLPALMIVAALGLRRLEQPALGRVALLLLVGWQVAQFGLLTVQPAAAMARPLQARTIIVESSYLYWPDSGATDSAYHVAPAVLDRLRTIETPDGRVSLSMLINDRQLHQNTLRAQFEMEAPGLVRVIPLTKDVEHPYREIFNTPAVLYKEGGTTDATPQARAATKRIIADQSGLFDATFTPTVTRQTPAGETIILAERRYALQPLSVQSTYRPLMEHLRTVLTPADVGLVDGHAQINAIGAYGWPETPIVVLDNNTSIDALAEHLRPGRRVFAILWNQDERTEPWLNGRLVRSTDWWFDDTHVIAYVAAEEEPALSFVNVGTLGTTDLTHVAIDQSELSPDGAFVVSLTWQAREDEPAPYRTVFQLFDAGGELIAQRDLPPPPAPWPAGAEISQQTALLLPSELGPAPACLLVVRYEPNAGTRLQTPSGEDHLAVCPWL